MGQMKTKTRPVVTVANINIGGRKVGVGGTINNIYDGTRIADNPTNGPRDNRETSIFELL